MVKYQFAFVFLTFLCLYLGSSNGVPHHSSGDIKDVTKPLVDGKVGIAKSVGAKIKLAAFKKLGVVKAIVKAPFVLGGKLAAYKIGAVKSLGALKVSKAKKILGLASEKVKPAKATVAAIPAAIASLKPSTPSKPSKSSNKPHTEHVYEFPASQYHHQQPHSRPYYASPVISSYRDGEDSVLNIIQPHVSYGVPN